MISLILIVAASSCVAVNGCDGCNSEATLNCTAGGSYTMMDKMYIEISRATYGAVIVGTTECEDCDKAEGYAKSMGWPARTISRINADDMADKPTVDPQGMLNYIQCSYSNYSTSLPQVFVGRQYVGGLASTMMTYYTGEGSKAVYEQELLKRDAMTLVDEGRRRSVGGRFFVLSKVMCPHCIAAKKCLKEVGVPDSDIELYEINDFLTHDEIKLYKKRLTGSPYTPYLAYNGRTLKNHSELQKVTGCTTPGF